MSSLSPDSQIAPNLSPDTVEVDTLTLSDLLTQHAIPHVFGILLVDAEGWDLVVLRGLTECNSRPEIIVTEDYEGSRLERDKFLAELGYTNAGSWGSDSIWVVPRLIEKIGGLHYPVHSVAALPFAPASQSGHACYDANASGHALGECWRLAGWAWTELNTSPPPKIIVTLRSQGSEQIRHFQAWRTPRPDVVQVFESPSLLYSGFRAYVDVPQGRYAVSVTQVESEIYTTELGEIDIGRS